MEETKATMPEWKAEIRARLTPLNITPLREATMIAELAQHLDDCYALVSSHEAQKERQPCLTGNH